MKCGRCKLWKWNTQGATIVDLKRQYKIHGKALGFCTHKKTCYPMFNYEKCLFIKEVIKDARCDNK